MSFNTWSAKDNPFCTLRRFVGDRRQRQVDSRDIEDATTALNKVAQENQFLCDKVDTMRREKEELQLRAEQMERESLGMREQGPQAARDEIAARLLAENKRLGAECGALDVNTQPREVPSDRVQDTDRADPFLALLEGYMHGGQASNGASPDNRFLPDNDRQAWNGDRSHEGRVPGNGNRPQLRSTQCAPSPPHKRQCSTDGPDVPRRQLKRSHTVASPQQLFDESDQLLHNAGDMAQRRRSTGGYQRRVSAPNVTLHRRASFNHSSVPEGLTPTNEESQQVYAAGVAAQRRRSRSGSRRCSSASSVGLSRRNSHRDSFGVEKLMSLLNDNTNKGQAVSGLACFVLCVLSTEGRPVEMATLKGLLADSTTRAKADCFLRYTVVNHLVTQLQSPNSARVFGDIRPLILESSTQFIEGIMTQKPVTSHRYSCPMSL